MRLEWILYRVRDENVLRTKPNPQPQGRYLMKKNVLKFVRVWKSNQNGWVYMTGGYHPASTAERTTDANPR